MKGRQRRRFFLLPSVFFFIPQLAPSRREIKLLGMMRPTLPSLFPFSPSFLSSFLFVGKTGNPEVVEGSGA